MTAKVADLTKTYQQDLEKASSDINSLQLNWINTVGRKSMNSDDVKQVGIWAQWAHSTDPDLRAKGRAAITDYYKNNGGPAITANDLDPELAKRLTGIPGALADVGSIVSKAATLTANVPTVGAVSWMKWAFPNTLKSITRATAKAKDAVKLGAEFGVEVVDVTEDTVKALSNAAEIAGDLAKVIGVAGVVFEVVGNVTQAAVSIAEWVNIGDYEQKLKDIQSASKQAVTTNDLKSMDSATLFSYLTAMTATGGQVGGVR
jgi:hypothetical protein